MPQDYRNFIGGEWVPARGGTTTEVRNPANIDEVLGLAAASDVDDTRDAIAAARHAQPAWGALPGPDRGRVLFRAAAIMEERKAQLADELSREEGKTRAEATGEVGRAVDLLRYFGGEGWRVGGQTIPADTPHTLLYTTRIPLGVVSIITPWNFPIAIPTWKIVPALVMGNAVIFKPASITPILATRLVEVLNDAGLPKGVINLVLGGGSKVGDVLVTDERVDGVSFTGSYRVGHGIYQKTAQRIIRTHLEMGGKNPVIVAADADIAKAVGIVVRGGFGLTGQACTSTSRVIVEKPILREFTSALVAAANAVAIGDPLADGVAMGPASSAGQRQTDLEYVEIGVGEGATLLAGGGSPEGERYGKGHFVRPTVFGDVKPDMRIAQEEIFGPVVGVLAADDLEHAFQLANNIDFGLSASIVTNDLRRAMRFAEQAEAGMIKINQPTPGVSVQAPFGGFKQSGSGMFKEMGSTAVDFYTRVKAVYFDAQ
jgi:2,5-dioxopentanoate dehydrogenase